MWRKTCHQPKRQTFAHKIWKSKNRRRKVNFFLSKSTCHAPSSRPTWRPGDSQIFWVKFHVPLNWFCQARWTVDRLCFWPGSWIGSDRLGLWLRFGECRSTPCHKFSKKIKLYRRGKVPLFEIDLTRQRLRKNITPKFSFWAILTQVWPVMGKIGVLGETILTIFINWN